VAAIVQDVRAEDVETMYISIGALILVIILLMILF
jgi:hypothetical protein